MSNVSHPSHYNAGKIEVIEFIEDQGLNFARGSAVKYVARAGKKAGADEVEDLEKAAWYCKREAERVRATREGREPVRPNDMNPRIAVRLDREGKSAAVRMCVGQSNYVVLGCKDCLQPWAQVTDDRGQLTAWVCPKCSNLLGPALVDDELSDEGYLIFRSPTP